MNTRLLKAKEVAAKLGVSRQHVYRLMREEKFPRPIKVGVRSVRWRESDIEQWMREGVKK